MPIPVTETDGPNQPKPVMGFRDLVLFYVVTGVSLRWIATAAAAGPSSIVIWIGAFLAFYTPLALSVIELSSRYPEEGGIYVWSKHAFGDFAGFITAWTYWACNLPYFPAVLYFAASNALYIRHDWARFSNNTTFYIVFSLVALYAGHAAQHFGLNVGTWLHNMGAVAMWIPVGIIVAHGSGRLASLRLGHFIQLHAMTPGVQLKDMIFWSVLIYRLRGMRDGLDHGRRNQERSSCHSTRAVDRRSDGDVLLHRGHHQRAGGFARARKSGTCRD